MTETTVAELDRLRLELEGRLRRLGSDVAHATGGEGGDEADRGTAALHRDQSSAQLVAARAKLAEVQAALARVDAGTFGICTRCGEPVGDERLEVLPATPTCRDCTAR